MSKREGAFMEAAKLIIEEDIKHKTKLIEERLENPTLFYLKYPELKGKSVLEIVFGDYQQFVNKWNASGL